MKMWFTGRQIKTVKIVFCGIRFDVCDGLQRQVFDFSQGENLLVRVEIEKR